MTGGEGDFDFRFAEPVLQFRGHLVAHVGAAGEGGEGGEHEQAVAVEEGAMAAFDLGGVAEFQHRVEVADDGEGAGFGGKGQDIAVDGADALALNGRQSRRLRSVPGVSIRAQDQAWSSATWLWP